MNEKASKYFKPVAQRKFIIKRGTSHKPNPLVAKKRVLYSGKNDCIIIDDDDDDDDDDVQCLGSYKTSQKITKSAKKFRNSVKDDEIIILNQEPDRLKTKLSVCKSISITSSSQNIESGNSSMNTFIPLHDFAVSDSNVCTLAQPYNSVIPTPPPSVIPITPQSQGFATLSLQDSSNVIVSGPSHHFPVTSLQQDPNVPTFIQIQDFPNCTVLNSPDFVVNTQAPALTTECMTLPNGTVLSNNLNAQVPPRTAEPVERINNAPSLNSTSYVKEQQALLTFRPKHEVRCVDIPANRQISCGSSENNKGQMSAIRKEFINSLRDKVIEQVEEQPVNKRAHSVRGNDYQYIEVITDTDEILHKINIKSNKRKKKNIPKKDDENRNVNSKHMAQNKKQSVQKPGQFSMKDVEEFKNLKSIPNPVPKDISDEIMPCDSQKAFDQGTQTSIHCWLFKNDKLYCLDENVESECNIRLEPVEKLRMSKNRGQNKTQLQCKVPLNKEVPDSSVPGSCGLDTSDVPTMPVSEVSGSVSQSENLEIHHTSPPPAEMNQPQIANNPAHGVFESGSAFTENTYLTLGLPMPTKQKGIHYDVDHIVPQGTETARSVMSETNNPPFSAPPGDQMDPPNMFPRSAASVANLPAPYVKLFNTICEDIRNALKFDKDCNIPLHDAVIDCDLKRVKSQCILLMGIKSNLNHRNVHGDTPLMLAVKLAVDLGGVERWKVVRLLLKEGADQTVADREEYTPLHYAVQYGSTNLVRTLLDADGSRKVIDKFCRDGLAPLHLAAIGGHDDIIEMLINAKADFNSKDMKSGRTPYFFAVEKENTSSANIFVKFKAKVNEPNFAGQYPPTKTLKVNQGDDIENKVENKSFKNSARLKTPFHVAETTTNDIEKDIIEDSMVVEEDGISGNSFTDLRAPVTEFKEQNCDISNLNRINEVPKNPPEHAVGALCRKSQDVSECIASEPNCTPEITITQHSPGTIFIENQVSFSAPCKPSHCPLSTSGSPIPPLNYEQQEQHQCQNKSFLRETLEMKCKCIDSNNVEKQKDTEISKNSLIGCVLECSDGVETLMKTDTTKLVPTGSKKVSCNSTKLNLFCSSELHTNIPSIGDRKSKTDEIKKTRNYPLSRLFSQTLDTDKSFKSCENTINNSSSNVKPQDIIQPCVAKCVETYKPSTNQPYQIKETYGNLSHNFDVQCSDGKFVSSNENSQKIIQRNVSECAETEQTPTIQSCQIIKSHQNSSLKLHNDLSNSKSLLSDAETRKLVQSNTSECPEIKQSSSNQSVKTTESHENSSQNSQDQSNDAEFVLSDDDDSDEDNFPSAYTTAKPTAEVVEQCNKRTILNNSTEEIDLEKHISNKHGLCLAQIDQNTQGNESPVLSVNEEKEEHVESNKTNFVIKNKVQRRSKRKISEEQMSNDESLSIDRRRSLRKNNASDSLANNNADGKSNQRTKQAKMSKALLDSKSITVPSNRSRKSQDNITEKQEEILIDSTKRTSKRPRKPMNINKLYLYT